MKKLFTVERVEHGTYFIFNNGVEISFTRVSFNKHAVAETSVHYSVNGEDYEHLVNDLYQPHIMQFMGHQDEFWEHACEDYGVDEVHELPEDVQEETLYNIKESIIFHALLSAIELCGKKEVECLGYMPLSHAKKLKDLSSDKYHDALMYWMYG